MDTILTLGRLAITKTCIHFFLYFSQYLNVKTHFMGERINCNKEKNILFVTV